MTKRNILYYYKKQGEITLNKVQIKGLSESEVELSRKNHGDNRIEGQKRESFFKKLLQNFEDPIIKILLVALAVNIIFALARDDFNAFESAGIAVAILTATLVSALSEYGSQMAFEKLRQESENRVCRVIRNGELKNIRESELVVNDTVLLSAGEKVPADGKLISGAISVNMSALTGESREIKKFALSSFPSGDKEDAKDCVLRGSGVISGQAVMRVYAVGQNTSYGSLATQLSEKTRISPLKLKLSKLADQISRIGYIAAAVIFVGYLFNAVCVESAFNITQMLVKLTDFPFMASTLLSALTIAVTVIVVAVPEGLPMMITVVLSSNMRRMIADNILVKKPVGIETAGCMNILFCDKTGTLTTGSQRVDSIVTGEGKIHKTLEKLSSISQIYRALLMQAEYNCESRISRSEIIGGNATDRAFAKAFGGRGEFESIEKISFSAFDSKKKYSSAAVSENGKTKLLVKGAPEIILGAVRRIYKENGEVTTAFNKELLYQRLAEMTEKAERVIAVAEGEGESLDLQNSSLTFVCFVCIRDKVRRDARSSVEKLRQAGVSVVMLTGDNKETAIAVGQECGILQKYGSDVILTGGELAKLSDDELLKALPKLKIVARALPSDKTRLVNVAQRAEMVVGMTGDGVNDAPALKKADVGFAMGNGSDVAKEAGDIVMLDNNLSYIVRSVVYGRTIFKSIRKFIVFQLTMNMCALAVTLIGPFIGIDSPITVMQMLWVNIIMDTLGALAFAGEAPNEEFLREKPKKRRESLVNSYMAGQIITSAIVTLFVCLFYMCSGFVRDYFEFELDRVYYLGGLFCLFIFLGIANCFMARTPRINLLSRLSKNKPFVLIMAGITLIQLLMVYLGGDVFRTRALHMPHLLFVFALTAVSVLVQLVIRISMRVSKNNSGEY